MEMRRRAALRWIGLTALAPWLAGCGDDGATAASSPPTTPAPSTTTAPASTTTMPRVTAVATTAATTTTEVPLPVPQPAPTDERAEEPYVELGTIAIPKLGVDKKLLEGISLNTLDIAPGHWPGTAMPGQLGNVVVAGHRTSHDRPFRHVDRLEPGDEVLFTTEAGGFTYHVTSVEIVMPDAVWIVDQTRAHTATLFACHPPHSTKQRIVVHLAQAPSE